MANKRIVDLSPLVSQMTTDIYEVSANGTGSFKESRLQQLNYIEQNILSPNNFVYIAINGSDITGNGSINNPYATLSHALSTITTASQTNPFQIIMATGQYSEVNLALKAFVHIEGSNSKLTVMNTIICDPNFTLNGGDCIITNLFNLTLINGINIDLSSGASSFFSLKNVVIQNISTWNFSGNPNGTTIIKLFEIQNLFTSPFFNFSNCNAIIEHGNIGQTTFINSGNTDIILIIVNCIINGILTITASSSANITSLFGSNLKGENILIRSTSTGSNQVFFTTNVIFKGITLDGIHNSLFTILLSSNPNYINGATPSQIMYNSLFDKIVTIGGNYTVTNVDNNALILVNNTSTPQSNITISPGSTLFKGFKFTVKHIGNDPSERIKIIPSASNQIDYWTYEALGHNQSVTLELTDATDIANFVSISTSGTGQNFEPIQNNNIDTRTLLITDHASFIYFPNNSNPKTLTLPNNATTDLRRGFFTTVYNPGPVSISISTTDTIQGPNIIIPRSVVQIRKYIYGTPNMWVITSLSLGLFNWQVLGAGPINMLSNTGYIDKFGLLTTFVLPLTTIEGDIIRIAGYGANGWIIRQNAGQKIFFHNTITTTGVGGSIASTFNHDSVELLCITANTEFQIISYTGTIADYVIV